MANGQRRSKPWPTILYAVVPVVAVGGGLGLYVSREPWPRLGIALLLTVAAFGTGVLVGFLFGIPRSHQPPDGPSGGTAVPPHLAVNTNLEQISDWLTKILVGVGLVELGRMSTGAGRLADRVGAALGGGAAGPVVAGALMISAGAAGFLVGYVTTRTRISQIFARADVFQLVDQRLDERSRRDARARELVARQLDRNEPPVDTAMLASVFAAASPDVRTAILLEAQAVRRRSWRASALKGELARTIPVFDALTKVEPNNHRAWGNLGFALKDVEPADDDRAITALTTAIGARGGPTSFGKETYEFARALVRVRRLAGGEPDPVTLAEIQADAATAYRSPDVRDRIAAALATEPAQRDVADREVGLLAPYLPERG